MVADIKHMKTNQEGKLNKLESSVCSLDSKLKIVVLVSKETLHRNAKGLAIINEKSKSRRKGKNKMTINIVEEGVKKNKKVKGDDNDLVVVDVEQDSKGDVDDIGKQGTTGLKRPYSRT